MPGPCVILGALKIARLSPGTPVEIKLLPGGAPMPAYVLLLNRALGSTRKTRCTLTSLKWFDTKHGLPLNRITL
jgi:hypothetical protein